MFFFDCSPWNLTNVIIRMIVSLVLGCIIGLDRGVKRRGAGTKTHTVVCLGSTLVALTSQYMEVLYPSVTDLTRMAAQVISGVGFLGVGTIFISDHKVRGLTTAASLWTCACIGLAVGFGFLDGGIITCIFLMIAFHVLPILDNYVLRKSKYFNVCFEIDSSQTIPAFLQRMKEEGIVIDTLEVIKPKMEGQRFSILATIKISDHKKRTHYQQILLAIPGVISLEDY